jgi:sensor histidine kinase YesM
MLENYNFSMSENELCAVFSNVLDNAIEACTNIVGFDPIIQVSLKKANDMLFFRVQNPCIQCQKNASGKFISTKDDKLLHGIGLRSVTSVIEKYDGHIVYDIEGNSFVIDIMM